ncbi:hypothetical protein [Haloarcula nitratireducens]|nr:hypothetical protein [Halomicroarcula nitratireducens]
MRVEYVNAAYTSQTCHALWSFRSTERTG